MTLSDRIANLISEAEAIVIELKPDGPTAAILEYAIAELKTELLEALEIKESEE